MQILPYVLQTSELKTLRPIEALEYMKAALRAIRNVIGCMSIEIIALRYFGNRDVYPDITYLIAQSAVPKKWVETVAEEFASKEIIRNANDTVVSFEYKNFQVNVILVPTEHISFSYDYYSYEHYCCLIEHFAKCLGYTLKSDGLYLEVKDGNTVIGEMAVTHNFQEMLGLIGLPGYNFGYGFSNPGQYYRYLASSAYFSKSCFPTDLQIPNEQINTIYKGFLDHLQTLPNSVNKVDFGSDKIKPWVTSFKRTNPGLIKKYSGMVETHRINQMIHSKYNETIVNTYTELSGSDLTSFCKDFRDSFISQEEFNRFILSSQPTSIETSIKNFFENRKIDLQNKLLDNSRKIKRKYKAG